MDNGLIFPYPRGVVRAQTADAKAVIRTFGRGGQLTLNGSRQAGGETQEASCTGRWSSRGKGVGRAAGKSAVHQA
jgi:hypothetical protein